MTAANDLAVRRALEAAGVEFIDENGGDQMYGFANRTSGRPDGWQDAQKSNTDYGICSTRTLSMCTTVRRTIAPERSLAGL